MTNNGKDLFFNELGKRFGICLFVKAETKVSKEYTHKYFRSGEFGSSIVEDSPQ